MKLSTLLFYGAAVSTVPETTVWTTAVVTKTVSFLPDATAPTKPPQQFYLKTRVVNGTTNHDDLYLAGYHTGAGMADASVGKKFPDWKAYQNGSMIQWLYDNHDNFETYLNMAWPSYVSWAPVSIDPLGGPTEGFAFVEKKVHLQKSKGGELTKLKVLEWDPQRFAGWWVCDWSHYGTPQLFWAYKQCELGQKGCVAMPNRISTCSEVVLIAENA